MRGIVLCLALSFSLSAMAEQSNFGSGSTSAAFLKIPSSVRSAGMAEASEGLNLGADSLYSNPANLAWNKGQQAGLGHNMWVQNVSIEHLGYGLGLFDTAGAAIGFDYLSYGSMDKVKANPDGTLSNDGTFTPTAYHLDLGYGQRFGSLAAGLAFKVISESIDTYSSSAFAADLGFGWQPEGLPSLGLTLKNLGSQMGGSCLPAMAKLGALQGFDLTGKTLNLGLDAGLPFNDSKGISVGLGAELWLNQGFALRTGYKAQDRGALAGISGLSAGLTAKISIAQLDYALTTLGDLGQSHQFGLSANF
jgi:hypothetical protein